MLSASMDSNLVGIVLGLVVFLAGVLFKGKMDRAKNAKKQVNEAKKQETQGAERATQEHAARQAALAKDRQEAVAKARAEAAASATADRTHSGDRVADLADRVRKHAARRQRERAGAGTS